MDVPRDMGVDDYLDWISEDIARIGDDIGLVGFSFGGAVAAAVAARLGQRINRLSLIGPAGFGNQRGRLRPLLPMPGRDAAELEWRAAIAHNLGEWMLREKPRPYDEVIDLHWENIRNARFDSYKVSLRESTIDDLANATCLVQVIWGADDPLAYPSIEARANLCKRARPDIQIHLVSGAGHWAQFEAPGAVDKLLISFHS